jgi:hypothetical protein
VQLAARPLLGNLGERSRGQSSQIFCPSYDVCSVREPLDEPIVNGPFAGPQCEPGTSSLSELTAGALGRVIVMRYRPDTHLHQLPSPDCTVALTLATNGFAVRTTGSAMAEGDPR